ncbi:RHS repeat domain-containing protein [Enterobacter mori]
MSTFTPELHMNTPSVRVSGSDGTIVLTLRLLRHPETPAAPARILVSRTVVDIPARTGYLYGARPLRAAPDTVVPDAVTVSSLTGQTLRLHTADGDASLALTDTAGRSLWARSAQGTVSTFTYEAPETAGRPLSVTETATTEGGGTVSRVRETFTYGPADGTHRARNLAGALTVHRHNAGCSRLLALSLTGQPLSTEEQLLAPEAALPDWPGSEAALEVSRLTTRGTYDATGAPLTQTNAAGVTTVTAYDVSGAVRESRLRYAGTAGEPEQDVVTLTDILYRADGVVLSQTAGNGITQTYEYDPKTQRLRRHTVQRPAGHPQGAQVISDLHYAYDPAGNILTLNEMATDAQWHRNRMTDGMRTYAYDTLYRLVSATGRERLPDTARGPQTRLAGTLQSDIVITDAGGVRLIQDRLSGETRLRYAFTDHLNSTSGETDEAGSITAREEYYPYGGSAGSDEEAEEIHDRTARYSGKERDATGLLYYGWRYYQPESGRWLSADPGGLIDGVNLFRFCRANPVNIIDTDGRGCSGSKVAAARDDLHDEMMARRAGHAPFNTGRAAGGQVSMPAGPTERPVMQTDEKWASWEKIMQGDHETIKLVHTLKTDHTESVLLNTSINQVISEWNMISTSLVDLKLWDGDRITYGEIAFVLKGSPANLIKTSSEDIVFRNHEPNEFKRLTGSELSERKPANDNTGKPKKFSQRMGIWSTEQLLATTARNRNEQMQGYGSGKKYNEVIVTGKGGYDIHQYGYLSTPLQVSEIIVLPDPEESINWNNPASPQLTGRLKKYVNDVSRVNPDLKLDIRWPTQQKPKASANHFYI